VGDGGGQIQRGADPTADRLRGCVPPRPLRVLALPTPGEAGGATGRSAVIPAVGGPPPADSDGCVGVPSQPLGGPAPRGNGRVGAAGHRAGAGGAEYFEGVPLRDRHNDTPWGSLQRALDWGRQSIKTLLYPSGPTLLGFEGLSI